MKKQTTAAAVILTLILAFMEISALPAALFYNVKIQDVDPTYITLLLNFLLAFAVCWVCKKLLLKRFGQLHWVFIWGQFMPQAKTCGSP